jgi:competence protein ComEC
MTAVQSLLNLPEEHKGGSGGQPFSTGRTDEHVASRLLLQTPPLYLSTLALIAGDALGNSYVWVPLWAASAAAIVAAVLFLLNRPLPGIFIALLGLSSAATLPVRDLLAPEFNSQTVRRFADGARVTLEGWLVREPEAQGRGRTYLYVDAANAESFGSQKAPATGLVRVTAIGQVAFRVGDRLRISGKIRFPRNDGDEDEFDYRAWLLRQGIAATIVAAQPRRDSAPPILIIGHRGAFPDSFLQSIRQRIARLIDATLPYPQNVEMRALIIGDRSGIDEPLRQPFALAGMAHLLVISGLHLGFVATATFLSVRLVMAVFPTLMALGYANKIAAGAAMAAVSGYAAIAGGHVSTIRALIMVLVFALGILLDRSRELMASLALAALIICFAIPGSTADIGFQLSFASVGVILLGMRRFSAWWRWRYANPLGVRTEQSRMGSTAEWLCSYLAVSLWAMIGTAPLTAFHFNQFSLVGMVANPIVVPIMGFGAVAFGLAATACCFIHLPLSATILIIAGKFAACGSFLARWFVGWPLAWARTFTPTLLEISICYGFILLWLSAPLAGADVLQKSRRRIGPPSNDLTIQGSGAKPRAALINWRRIAAAVLTVALAVDGGWWTYQRFFCSELRVTFLSVGEGDAAVVRFPGSRVMLIDGGGGFGATFDPGERIIAPFLWSRKIMRLDYIALSHPDRDHFGGLIFMVRNFAPSQFWTAGAVSDDASYGELLAAVKASGARHRLCDSAAPPVFIAGASVRCVGPLHGAPKVTHNNSSMILRLAFGREAFLFAGDVEAKGERDLVASAADLRATILKVPHHGSRTSSTDDFIKAVDPGVAVISLGYLNHFHFPAPEVIQRYQDDGVEVLRTDQDGAITVIADPRTYRLTTFRHTEDGRIQNVLSPP